MNNHTTLLVDGDVLAYRAAWKAETVQEVDTDLWAIIGDLKEARGHYEHMLEKIRLDYGGGSMCSTFTVFSDPKKNFRYDIFPDYKKSRHKPGNRKPVVYTALRDWLLEHQPVKHQYLPGCEGDDALGILQDEDTVICTIDKDLRCIPGRHYNFDKGLKYEVGHQEAHEFFLTQALAGDPTDGIPGCPGIGMKTAEKALKKDGYTWDTVLKVYDKAGLSSDYALQQARLVRILTPDLWCEVDDKVILWTPEEVI